MVGWLVFNHTGDLRQWGVLQERGSGMKSMIWVLAVAILLISGCVWVGQGKSAPPGQVQKATGYNPASGKIKVK
jgi:hypothetical protein